MLEMGTSGLMSGEGKQPSANRLRSRALPRLYASSRRCALVLRDISPAMRSRSQPKSLGINR